MRLRIHATLDEKTGHITTPAAKWRLMVAAKAAISAKRMSEVLTAASS
jgi:hypothetical protein